MTTAAEKRHMSKVADLGCIVCANNGFEDSPAELHHPRFGAGMGQRSSHEDVLPLCPTHHRTGSYGFAIHAGKKVWESNYGTERKLLEQVKKLATGQG